MYKFNEFDNAAQRVQEKRPRPFFVEAHQAEGRGASLLRRSNTDCWSHVKLGAQGSQQPWHERLQRHRQQGL
jgi:hypothetical protein